MEQVFRIEIPVEATDKTDTGVMKALEATLSRIFTSINQDKKAIGDALNTVEKGAMEANAAVEKMNATTAQAANEISALGKEAAASGAKQEQAAEGAAQATEAIEESASKAADALQETGEAAADAGRKSGSAFKSASAPVDKFTQRMEKSEKTLRSMFNEKWKLTISAIDKASPILKSILTSAKSLIGRTWSVAVRMKDMITAPFRKLYNWIANPITIALSVAGIGVGLGSFYSTFGDFTSGMSTVRAVTGATDAEFQTLTETAQNLGETTKFTATEAAQGMQYLGMAGWQTSEIIAAMPGLLDLAAAGATDLGTAADIVSDVMTAMGMSADQAGRAADIFAKAAAISNTSVEGLGMTMKYAAPIAYAFGLSLEDISAAAALMANAGIKGEMAGTALRQSLLRMSNPTADMASAMKKLNISFSDSTGKMKSMSDIVRMLSTAFSGLSEAERLQYAQELFSTEAASAWLGIINQGADTYDTMAKGLYDANGAAKEMANTQLDNITGDVTLLNSALDGMKINLMTKLNPYLREAVQWFTSKVPAITEGLSGLMDRAIAKAKKLTEFFSGVFSSSEFQNADGFAEKLMVAWDKIIAEPFQEWWNGGGKEKILGTFKNLGEQAGTLLSGIITGIFAGLKGEEVDFGEMNVTGLAAAGGEAAKTFIQAFKDNFDFGEIMDSMPGILKALLFGYGAIKVGGAANGIFKLGKLIKSVFGGVGAAAASAGVATEAVGTSAVAAAAGAGKAAVVFGGLKTAIAAIPVWGWAAAAAVTAAAIGIKLYADAQERQRENLLHIGDGVSEAARTYQHNVEQMNEASAAIDEIREVKLKIAREGLSTTEITEIQAELASVQSRIVYIEAVLSGTSLTPAEIKTYGSELEEIKDRKAYIEAQLSSGTLTPSEVTQYQAELDKLTGREAYVEAVLSGTTLTPEQIAAYQAELDELQGREVTLTAKLAEDRVRATEVQNYVAELSGLQSREEFIRMELEKGVTGQEAANYMAELSIIQSREATITLQLEGLGVTAAGVAYATRLVEQINGKKAEVTVLLSKSSLTSEQIDDYVSELQTNKARQVEIELTLTGSGLTPVEIARLNKELDSVGQRKREIQIAAGLTGMTDALQREYNNLTDREATISLMLSGTGLSEEQLGALTEEFMNLQSREAAIYVYMDEAGMSESDIVTIAKDMEQIGDKTAKLNVTFETGSLDEAALAGYNAQLDSLYEKISPFIKEQYGIDLSPEALKTGAYDSLIDTLDKTVFRQKQEADLNNLEASIITAKQQVPALQTEMTSTQGEISRLQAENASTVERMTSHVESIAAIQEAGSEYALNKSGFQNGTVTDEQNAEFLANYSQRLFDAYSSAAKATNPDLTDKQIRMMYDTTIGSSVLSPHEALLQALKGMLPDDYANVTNNETRIAQLQSEYDTAHGSLRSIYEGDKQLSTGRTFIGTDQAGQSLEQIAANYATLDEAGRALFADAVKALDELNKQTTYLPDTEKTQATDIIDLAAKSEVLAAIKDQVQGVADKYSAMDDEQKAAYATSAEGAAALASVNNALESLGKDKIDNLSSINTALESLATLDLTTFSLDDAQAAFAALSGKASGLKTTVDSLRTSLQNLDGTTATVGVTMNRTTTYRTGGAAENANGGIYDGAFLSWVAEDGPEAIIPLGMDRRDRGIDLWLRAGQMLGVSALADGGIMAPYAAAIGNIPDDIDDEPRPISGGGGGISITITVDANPVFQVEGGEGDIIEKLKGRIHEFAQLVGEELGAEIEDIVTNMA